MKEKIIIHTYPARLWYVMNFLVPALQDQGIENIIIKNDKYHIGNLLAFVLSLENVGDAWHLQDDVCICKDFAKRIRNTKQLSCGFYAEGFETGEIIEGKTNVKNMWYSFPCLFIPGDIAQSFYKWFQEEEKTEAFNQMIRSGKMDDLIFKEYLIKYFPDMEVNNIKPNLVDHIDYLIGGSTINRSRRKIARSGSFPDKEIVDKLASDIEAYKVQHKML